MAYHRMGHPRMAMHRTVIHRTAIHRTAMYLLTKGMLAPATSPEIANIPVTVVKQGVPAFGEQQEIRHELSDAGWYMAC